MTDFLLRIFYLVNSKENSCFCNAMFIPFVWARGPLCLSLWCYVRQRQGEQGGGGVKKNPKNGRICIAADLSDVEICQHLQHRSGVLFFKMVYLESRDVRRGQKEPIHWSDLRTRGTKSLIWFQNDWWSTEPEPEKFIFMPYRVHCALLGWAMFAWCHFLPFVCFLGFEFAQMFFVFFFLCVFGVWRSSWLWIQHPVTAKF